MQDWARRMCQRLAGEERAGQGGMTGAGTLLMLNWPSKRQPAPLLSGIFMELSIWPTSCRPISSWMSSPTTAEAIGSESQRHRCQPPLTPQTHRWMDRHTGPAQSYGRGHIAGDRGRGKKRGIHDGERREEVVVFRYRGYNVHFQRPGLRGIHPAEGEAAGRQQRTGTKDHQDPGVALHWGEGGVVTPHSAWWNLGLLHVDVTFTSCV